MIDEHRPVARNGLHGFLRDMAEVEIFLGEFASQHPDLRVVSLRMAPLIVSWAPLMDYFLQPGPRMLMGFDPSLQLLSIEDAVDALAHVALTPCAGTFNIAADDAVCISQAIRLCGQLPMPTIESMIKPSSTVDDRRQLREWPVDIDFLRYSCIVDTYRAKNELGWSPKRSIADSISTLRLNGQTPNDRVDSEAALRAFLSRKR
ncbi:MAG: hypothetical protein HGA65_14160 [Oscillochloris sp.]|nr:hypothetical protein [Oscillochloris sp.]